MKYIAFAFLAIVLAVSGALGLTRSGSPDRQPVTTSSVDPQAVDPHAVPQDLSGAIDALQVTLRRVPGDYQSWATLSLAYVEQARITGNPSYYGKAGAAAAKSLEVQPTNNPSAHAATAALDAARHDFSAALKQANLALHIDPYNPGALAVRVDALTELGRYAEEMRALALADRRQPGVPIFARYSYAYELRGRLRRAAALLTRAAEVGSHSDRGFLFTLRADLDRRDGHLPAAGRDLHQALRESPGYLPALASRARLAVAEGKPDVALRRWKDVVGQLPLPEYVTELGELYLALGQPDLAQQQFSLVQTTVDLLASNGVDTDLESALFEADHGDPAAALADARAEWRRRKSLHVADVLAWALHVNGRDRAALPLTRAATRLGTEEARLWLHRGTIEAALGLDRAARRDLRHGLRVDPGASPWQADRARAVLHTVGVSR